jgi:hypothetical protein
MEIKYSPPDIFYPKQQDIYDCPERYTVVISANKTGKTLALACWINEQAILGAPDTKYCWLAPFSKTSTIGYELVRKIIMGTNIYKHLKETNHEKQFKFNSSSPQKITYPNGNVIDFAQGQNVDSLFGEQYEAAVVDEATRLKQEIRTNGDKQEVICPAFDALKTTMRISQGPIKIISNPTCKSNYFYQWYLKIKDGKDERAKAFHLSSQDSVDAGFLPQEEFDYAKEHESSYIFKRDWLGEVPEEENSVFLPSKVYECIDDDIVQNISKAIYFGIDLGFTDSNKADFTVVTGINKIGELVFFKRFKAEGEELINKLKAYINNRKSYIDATAGGGITVYNLLKNDCPNLEPFTFSNKSKCSTIENLVHFIHAKNIKYPNLDILIDELLGYECEISSTGNIIYNNGKRTQHDDTVISLALAVLKYKEVTQDGDNTTMDVYDLSDDEQIDGHDGWTSIGEDYNSFNYNLG